MKRRILLVDDDPLQMRWVSRGLTRAGYEVLTAANGIDALSRAFEHPPDVIVADANMGIGAMSGLDLCQRVRADHRLSFVPVVLISGLSFTQNDCALAVRMGVTAVVSIEPDRSLTDLLDALRSLLGPEAA